MLGADKAPRLYGFPIFIFQKHWDFIQNDLFKLCTNFFND